ncbi:MAG: cobalamin-binding protein [Alistipes senegalensis]|nr:cobalamin-binding protein [Oxalobacter formigenes]MCM1281346.1 cobalamin-binding protein [Alistipes senegalensis]
MKKFMLALAFCFSTAWANAADMLDDDGRLVRFSFPARRIISAAPHITELLYEAGGGGHIAGVTGFSDFPPEARALSLVGDNRQINVERVLALKPDLLIAWRGGNPVRQIDQLQRMGIPVFYSNPKRMEDIPATLERFGTLVGQEARGREKARLWRLRLAQLKKLYAKRERLRVFYQVSERPLYTLNGSHIISEVIRICGGENVFSDLPALAPRISMEAVLEKDPDVIFISGSGGQAGGGFWRRFGMMAAVRQDNLFEVEADLMDRPGPRLIEGAAALCKKMDEARQRRRAR